MLRCDYVCAIAQRKCIQIYVFANNALVRYFMRKMKNGVRTVVFFSALPNACCWFIAILLPAFFFYSVAVHRLMVFAFNKANITAIDWRVLERKKKIISMALIPFMSVSNHSLCFHTSFSVDMCVQPVFIFV